MDAAEFCGAPCVTPCTARSPFASSPIQRSRIPRRSYSDGYRTVSAAQANGSRATRNGPIGVPVASRSTYGPAAGVILRLATPAEISSVSRHFSSTLSRTKRHAALLGCWGSRRMSEDPFSPLCGEQSVHAAASDDALEWIPLQPVPDDAAPAPERHPKLGKPSQTWCYRDASGGLLGLVCRFDPKSGKQFRPLTLFRPTAGGAPEWRWEARPTPRSLYGLEKLAARPRAPVVVCEGEKAADAAQRLLPEQVCITSPNGSKGAAKADWIPLAGRQIVLWPDADKAGTSYADAVSELVCSAGAASVAIAAAPAGAMEGWDAADAEAQGWTQARAEELTAAAKLLDRPPDRSTKAAKPRRKPQRDSLMALCDCVKLWHGEDGEGFATISRQPSPRELAHSGRSRSVAGWRHARIRSRLRARRPSARRYSAGPGGTSLSEGPQSAPWRRIGAGAGKIYVDMGDPCLRAIAIASDGFDIVAGDVFHFCEYRACGRFASRRPVTRSTN